MTVRGVRLHTRTGRHCIIAFCVTVHRRIDRHRMTDLPSTVTRRQTRAGLHIRTGRVTRLHRRMDRQVTMFRVTRLHTRTGRQRMIQRQLLWAICVPPGSRPVSADAPEPKARSNRTAARSAERRAFPSICVLHILYVEHCSWHIPEDIGLIQRKASAPPECRGRRRT
jgi:hypothetical protein